jgi:hypothetical protein
MPISIDIVPGVSMERLPPIDMVPQSCQTNLSFVNEVRDKSMRGSQASLALSKKSFKLSHAGSQTNLSFVNERTIKEVKGY